MEKQVLSLNQFVQVNDGGIGTFGIIADFNCDTPETAATVNVMCADMDEEFGTWNLEIKELRALEEHEIRERLATIQAHANEYPFFIIQINDIEELASYHLEENEEIRHIRTTSEVLNS